MFVEETKSKIKKQQTNALYFLQQDHKTLQKPKTKCK